MQATLSIGLFGPFLVEAVDEDAMKAFFDKFDTDANGTISFDEWLGQAPKWRWCEDNHTTVVHIE